MFQSEGLSTSRLICYLFERFGIAPTKNKAITVKENIFISEQTLRLCYTLSCWEGPKVPADCQEISYDSLVRQSAHCLYVGFAVKRVGKLSLVSFRSSLKESRDAINGARSRPFSDTCPAFTERPNYGLGNLGIYRFSQIVTTRAA
jgi:hypothetical protein